MKIIADEETNDLLRCAYDWTTCDRFNFRSWLARVLDATPWEIANTIHPHPSLSEAIGEAALALVGIAIHS